MFHIPLFQWSLEAASSGTRSTQTTSLSPQSETAKVVSEKNKLKDSVERKDREGFDHDLEDEMWS